MSEAAVERRPTRGHNSRRVRGETVTEFALLAPVLVLILFGVLELGRVLDAWVVVHNAAREGARVAAVSAGSSTDAANAGADAALDYLDTALSMRGDIPSSAYAASSAKATTDQVTVIAETRVMLYTPVMTNLLKSALDQGRVPVRAAATMRRQ